MINWNSTKEESKLISKIVSRYMNKCAELNISAGKQMNLNMDISATHLNGNPLKLNELLKADDTNFMHDVNGIRQYIDRTTGKLQNCFVPRYSN